VGGGGKNYTVSLFHGPKTGHVLILLNGKILQIDFSVRQSKTYSFFIEDEFCEVHLERRGDEMYYFFEINKKVDTPRNRDRKKRERKYLGQTLAFFSILLLVAIVSALWFRAWDKKREKKQLEITVLTDSTIAWVQLDSLSKTYAIQYFYVVGPETYSRYFFENEGSQLPEIPLQSGDEFFVRYHPGRPDQSEISFARPTEKQVGKYVDRVMARHLLLNPDAYPPHVRCTLQLVLEKRGLSGLADFFFQDKSPEINPAHNKDAYHRLIRDPAFQQEIAARCWD